MRVGRCAPEPHLGALRTVEGPIMLWTCAGRGDPMGMSKIKLDPAPLGCGEVPDEVAYLRDSGVG